MTEDQDKNVKFIGNHIKRDDAISFVDKILKEKGNFDDYADLSGGLDIITHEYRVLISDDDDSFAIVIEPLSSNMNNLNFTIYKSTGTVYRPPSEMKLQSVDDEDIDFLDEL